MIRHTVIYTLEGEFGWQYFRCMADDDDHAAEQCLDAYQEASVLLVVEGHASPDTIRQRLTEQQLQEAYA